MADTTYIVLRHNDQAGLKAIEPEGAWVYVTRLDAKNPHDAIRKTIADTNPPTAMYVAVPARSWKPVQVEAVQTTVLKLT